MLKIMHGHIVGSGLALDAVENVSHNQLVATKRAATTSKKNGQCICNQQSTSGNNHPVAINAETATGGNKNGNNQLAVTRKQQLWQKWW